MKQILVFVIALTVVIAVVRRLRNSKGTREQLHYGSPDPSNLIPTRAEREEAERRQRWLEENPGKTPPWLLPPTPKTTRKEPPPKEAA